MDRAAIPTTSDFKYIDRDPQRFRHRPYLRQGSSEHWIRHVRENTDPTRGTDGRAQGPPSRVIRPRGLLTGRDSHDEPLAQSATRQAARDAAPDADDPAL